MANDNWQTPPEVLEVVREFFGGQISLDPCTTADNPTGAAQICDGNGLGDGLAIAWHSNVFANPPYSRGNLYRWTHKMASEGLSRWPEVIGLIPADTSTHWWHDNVKTADLICFWKGRIKFIGAKQGAKFGSALPYWGKQETRFYDVFSKHGMVVAP